MRQVTETLYSIEELKSKFPSAYDLVIRRYSEGDNAIVDLQHISHEIFSSLKELIKHSGLTLGRYSLGTDRRYLELQVRFDKYHEDVPGLSGARAMAWLENNVLNSLRIAWMPYQVTERTRHLLPTEDHTTQRRKYAKYGMYYRPGLIEPCPLTGVCYDEDMIAELRKNLKEGRTLKEAYEDLQYLFCGLLEREEAYHRSEECIYEGLIANGHEFTKDGEDY